MAKIVVNLCGKSINMNTENPKVAGAIKALIEACAERRFAIGDVFTHLDDDGGCTDYLLTRVKDMKTGICRAYLHNTETGIARNSTKVVLVKMDDAKNYPNGYVTTLPCVKDRFFDPENPGQFIPLDD